MKPLILTALDDSDDAWYEMLVPFLLSLRMTDYTGDIGVLCYGMRQEKHDILAANNIIAIRRDHKPESLACDRYLAAADFVVGSDYTHMALYDADIWFQAPQHDLFAQIKDNNKIYACLDVWASGFIEDAVIGNNRAELIRIAISETMRLHGSVFQAGLLAGGVEGWQQLAGFMRHCLTLVGQDFQYVYGLDTTLINLFAGFENFIALPHRYNYVPKRGISEGTEGLKGGDELIAALHMTTDVRYNHVWRFYNRFPEQALSDGAAYALASVQLQDYALSHVPQDFLEGLAKCGWKIIALSSTQGIDFTAARHSLLIAGAGSGVFAVGGSSTITLEAVRTLRKVHILTGYVANTPSPIRFSIKTQGQVIELGYSAGSSGDFAEGTQLVLQTDALPGQRCTSLWGLSAPKG